MNVATTLPGSTPRRLFKCLAVASVGLSVALVVLSGCSASPGGEVGTAPARGALSGDETEICRSIFGRTDRAPAAKLVLVVDQTASIQRGQDIPRELNTEIERVSREDSSLTVLAADGSSVARIVAKDIHLGAPGPSRDVASVKTVAALMPRCVAARFLSGTDTKPLVGGTDLYAVMKRANQFADAKSTVWVMSDFMSNRGPFALTPDLTSMDAATAAANVARRSPLKLVGAWKVAGVGNTSSILEERNRDWMLEFSKSTCVLLGCKVIPMVPVNAEGPVKSLPNDPLPVFPGIDPQPVGATCTFTLPGVLFAGSSTHLRPGSLAALQPVMELLRQQPDASVTITGHTASVTGVPARQLEEFGKQRALTVKKALGNTTNITAKGVGDTQPLGEDINPKTGDQLEPQASRERRVVVSVRGVPCSR